MAIAYELGYSNIFEISFGYPSEFDYAFFRIHVVGKDAESRNGRQLFLCPSKEEVIEFLKVGAQNARFLDDPHNVKEYEDALLY